jgi:hypothetical protein
MPQAAMHHAQVVFVQGQLEITADNSSLNQILREVGSQTGMKITGGVTDERVFGKYGPGAPAEILANLLEGTGSNMLLRNTAANVPTELILTPQGGGPTPPNPNARGFDDDSSDGDQPAPPEQQAPPPRPIYSAPPNPQPAVNSNTNDGNNSSGAQPAAGNPASPNGVQTPQQIYEQLQRLQQQQQQTNPQ